MVYNLLFGLISSITVFSYYFLGNSAGWVQRSVTDRETAYWNAFQTLFWSFGILIFRGYDASFWTILPILPTAFIYGEISEQPGFDFDLSSSIKPGPLTLLIILGILFIIYVMYVMYIRSQCCSLYMNIQFFLPLIIFIGWFLTWLSFLTTKQTTINGNPATTTYSIHFHHWIIGIIGMLLAKNGGISSDIISGIFWGVFCQEMAAYGIDIPLDIRTKVLTKSNPLPHTPHVSTGYTKYGNT